MTNVYVDRARATRLMGEAQLDALLVFQPETVAYVTGVHPGPAALFRQAGAAAAIVPADPALTLAGVMPDLSEGAVKSGSVLADIRYHPIWVGTMKAKAIGPELSLAQTLPADPALPPRPTTFDTMAAFALARDQLTERGLARARLGIDLSFVPAVDLVRLRQVLPAATLLDATGVIGRLKMVKSAAEIRHLRDAVALSEIGFAAAADAVAPGVTRQVLSETYGQAVAAAARARGTPLTGKLDYMSVGPDPWGAGKPIGEGDIIKLDCAAVVAGYCSDMARTWVFGRPARAASELHAALLAGLEAGLSMLRPGVALRDLHARMTEVVTSQGVAGYRRGHFGHGVGHDVFAEQWPFIAADSDVIAEEGMVLSVEAPLYVDGLGGFIIEDQVLVTATGLDNMSTIDRAFRRFG